MQLSMYHLVNALTKRTVRNAPASVHKYGKWPPGRGRREKSYPMVSGPLTPGAPVVYSRGARKEAIITRVCSQ